MQSFQSLLDARCGTDGRNPVQQVLKVALLFPVSGKEKLFPSRKGVWDRVRKGLVPFEAGGTVPTRDL
jgi:hypothetical protein